MANGVKKITYLYWALFPAIFLSILNQAPTLANFLSSPDSGYQLGLGSQILLGKFPYTDLVFHYGPLVAFASAFCQWLTGNLLSEVSFCALGYAASITLLFLMVRDLGKKYWSFLLVIMGYLLMARFYKWYYWLFPLALLYLLGSICRQEELSRKKYLALQFAAGVIAGIGALFRFDLGMVFVVFFLACLFLALIGRCRYPCNIGYSLGSYFCGFLLPLGSWLAILFWKGGVSAVRYYFYAIFSGGTGVVAHWGISLPPFAWTDPFSSNSAIVASLTLLPVLYICCIGFGMYGMKNSDSQKAKKENLFLAAAGIMGLGIYPQGYYRADLPHVLQVIPPALVGLPLLVSLHWQGLSALRLRVFGKRAVILFVVAWGWLAFIGLLPHGRSDLADFSANGLTRLRQLLTPLDAGKAGLPKRSASLQALMNAVLAATRPNDPILVIPLIPQVYYFTRRPMSGILIGYAEGIHDDTFWREKNLAEVERNSPKVVIAARDFLAMNEDDPFRRSQPELYSYLAANYRETVYQQDGWLVLGRSGKEN